MSSDERPTRKTTVLLALIFSASGASALMFESLWFRQAGLAFGNGIWASSLVLAAFMGGLALGNALAARIGDRLATPLKAFAVLELLVGVTGLGLVALLPNLASLLAPLWRGLETVPIVLNALRLIIAFALLAIPATAMGTTLPLLVRALGTNDDRFGRVLGLLYGANTAGAVLGVIATEWQLLESVGVYGTATIAALIDASAAAAAVGLSARFRGAAGPATRPTWTGLRYLAVAFLAGFALLALEVVWFRVLTLFINDTPAAFAMVLAAVLCGIAAGGFVASTWLAKNADADRFAAFVAMSAGVAGIVGYVAYPRVLVAWLRAQQPSTTIFAISMVLVFPTALLSGVLFTLIGAALRRTIPLDAATTGRVTLANTLGATLGPLVAGFVLLPIIGMEYALVGLFALYGIMGAILVVERPWPSAVKYGSGAAFLACFGLLPLGETAASQIGASARRWMTRDDRILRVRETASATIVHVRHRRDGLDVNDQIATNAYSMTTNDFAARRYMGLYAYLPLAIHPHIEKALVVGYGLGNTAGALTSAPEIREIHVAEISQAMLEVSKGAMNIGGHPLEDPRMRLHIEDGRLFLNATRERFDLITGEPPPPIVAGVDNLYSREYFALVRSRLTDGGFATYWLPTMNIGLDTAKAIVRAFCTAFDDCSIWHGSGENFMLVGTNGSKGGVSKDRFEEQWSNPQIRQELESVGFEHPSQLGALFIGGSSFLSRMTDAALPVADAWPKRMHQPKSGAKKAWLEEVRDTEAARERFMNSPWIRRHWPEPLYATTLKRFDIQRLLNDLLFRSGPNPRNMSVLDRVLKGTPLKFPVLLILNSDPDIQRALARLPESEQQEVVYARDVVAGLLSRRRVGQALSVLRRWPSGDPFNGGLTRYLEGLIAEFRSRQANRQSNPGQTQGVAHKPSGPASNNSRSSPSESAPP